MAKTSDLMMMGIPAEPASLIGFTDPVFMKPGTPPSPIPKHNTATYIVTGLDGQGVQLPAEGITLTNYLIWNQTDANLYVYPPDGHTITPNPVSVALPLAPRTVSIFSRLDATTWSEVGGYDESAPGNYLTPSDIGVTVQGFSSNLQEWATTKNLGTDNNTLNQIYLKGVLAIGDPGTPGAMIVAAEAGNQNLKVVGNIKATIPANTPDSVVTVNGAQTLSHKTFGNDVNLGVPASGTLSNCTGFPAPALTGIVDHGNGGTGLTNYNPGDLLIGAPSGGGLIHTAIGTQGQVLTVGGAGLPVWQNVPSPPSPVVTSTTLYDLTGLSSFVWRMPTDMVAEIFSLEIFFQNVTMTLANGATPSVLAGLIGSANDVALSTRLYPGNPASGWPLSAAGLVSGEFGGSLSIKGMFDGTNMNWNGTGFAATQEAQGITKAGFVTTNQKGLVRGFSVKPGSDSSDKFTGGTVFFKITYGKWGS